MMPNQSQINQEIKLANKDNMPREQLNLLSDESCIVYQAVAKNRDGRVSFPVWGRDKQLSFVCPYDVVISSYLLGEIKSKNKPHVLHMISIKSPQRIDITLRDKNGNLDVEQLIIKSLMLSGRHRILNQRLGLYDCSQNNVDVIKSLGNALLRGFKVKNANMLSKCPYCSGQAVYRHYMNDMQNPAKECVLCGWRGYDSFCNGRGEVVTIPLTKTVRDYLNGIGLANAEDKYEFMFKSGIKPYRLIANIKRFALQDLRNAKKVIKDENRGNPTAKKQE